MNLLNLRDLTRTLTYSTSWQVSDSQLNIYLNIVYKTLVEDIHQDVREDYMADIFTTDTVASQCEYTLPERGWSVPWLSNVTGVSINYKKDWVDNWRQARAEKLSNLDHDLSYYETAQSYTDPFYIIYDTGLRIYPTTQESTTGWLKIYGTKEVLDLSADVDVPLIDQMWHYVIAIWAKQYVFAQRGQFDKQTAAINEYTLEKKKMLNSLTDRDLSPVERLAPITTKYE